MACRKRYKSVEAGAAEGRQKNSILRRLAPLDFKTLFDYNKPGSVFLHIYPVSNIKEVHAFRNGNQQLGKSLAQMTKL